jgi:hypothetical protein
MAARIHNVWKSSYTMYSWDWRTRLSRINDLRSPQDFCHTSVFMTLCDTWHHNKISKARRANNVTRDSKSVNLTHFRRLSICNLFSRNTSHSHHNLRRVSKSPLLHLFTHRRSGTLDWRVTKATSADSSRLIHTILAHSSIALFYSSTSLSLSIFCQPP